MLKQSINLAPVRPQLYQAKLLFFLFLVSLGMFFIASIITYTTIRHQSFSRPADAVPGSIFDQGPDHYQSLVIPLSFWLSTLILVVNSWLLHQSIRAVRREKQSLFRRYLWLSLGSGILFVGIQSFGMRDLWLQHFSSDDGSTKVFGMTFALSFIHALHVIGGMSFLGFVIVQANRSRYDHERHWPVDNCASYWHFLGFVWVLMLITFYLTR